jgi:hypothetical protein
LSATAVREIYDQVEGVTPRGWREARSHAGVPLPTIGCAKKK